MTGDRLAPEAFLAAAKAEGRGQLKVFLGAAPGVGKTYEMLEDGAARLAAGDDVVIGVVESHGRAETAALTRPFEIVPRRDIPYQGRTLDEMDLDAVLARRPRLVLVDELAHSNAPGSRQPKRYQDVEELIAAGIDVFSTINIQHIESLNDVVASFTRVRVRETVPDHVLEGAEIEVVDLPPDELIARLKAGKVYIPDEASRALGHFFSKSNLQALRELALRRAAHVVDAQLLDYVRVHSLAGNFAAGERVAVAVSELPGAPGLVRAGKRLADALRAPWTAVHIETPRSRLLGDADRQRLAGTLALAAQLGGATASIPANTVVEGLVAYATEARITQLVVAKSTRSRWFQLRHGSVVDRLVRETPGIAVHVLPDDASLAPAPLSLPIRQPGPPPRSYALALALVAATIAAAAAAAAALVPLIGLGAIDLLFLLPVMAAASLYGLRPGLVAGLAASLSFNFFFLPPLYTFTIAEPANIVTAAMLLGVAVVTSQLAGRVRAQADLAASSARQNAALAGFARHLTGGTDLTELAQAIVAELARVFDARVTLWLPEDGALVLSAANPPEDCLGEVERAAAHWVLDRGLPAGRGSETLPAADWLFHPLKTSSGVVGVLGLARDDGRDPVRADRLPLLLSLLDQSALAVERLRLTDEMAEVSRLKDRDRLRAALLSSVSHDLRTPLTAVIAAAAEVRAQLPAATDPAAIDTLDVETQRLARFVSNLLDMARVEAGALRLALEPVDLTDAVASAVHDLRRSLAGHAIDLDVPPDLPLVRVDPQLFHHCLINLLDNAGKYSDPGAPITIRSRRTADAVTLAILDAGPGLPPGREAEVFETFTRIEGSDRSVGGTGLGLAIVKGFAEAMGLTVEAANRDDPRGAVFTLRFPAVLLLRAIDAKDIP